MMLPDEERKRIAQAYGAAVPPTAQVVRVPVGASGLPQMIWRPTGPMGGQIVYADGGKNMLRRQSDMAYKRVTMARPQVKAAQARRAKLKELIEAGAPRDAILAQVGYSEIHVFYDDLKKLGLTASAVKGCRKSRRAA